MCMTVGHDRGKERDNFVLINVTRMDTILTRNFTVNMVHAKTLFKFVEIIKHDFFSKISLISLRRIEP